MKKFLWSLLIIIFCFLSLEAMTYADFNITLDPGHGGIANGAQIFVDPKTNIILNPDYNPENCTIIKEKVLNLKMANFVKNKLLNYETANHEKVNVYLTRDNDDSNPSLAERATIAKNNNSNVFVSLHFNASNPSSKPMRGAMILVTSSNFNNLYDKEEKLARLILQELNNIGIPTSRDVGGKGELCLTKFEIKDGLLRRLSDDGTLYPNDDLTDWYGIIRNGSLQCIPTVLIESCHLDDPDDYENFLTSDDKLENIADAIVRAIARCYDLVRFQ